MMELKARGFGHSHGSVNWEAGERHPECEMEPHSCCQCLGRRKQERTWQLLPEQWRSLRGSGAERGQVTPADPFPVSSQEQQVLKDQHPRLQSWKGEPGLGGTRPPKLWDIRWCWLSDLQHLILSLTSSWGSLHIQARTGGSAWPQTPSDQLQGLSREWVLFPPSGRREPSSHQSAISVNFYD